jgi:7,8-dihydro-6-hydroxymethylpterin-pyrophosphokinase
MDLDLLLFLPEETGKEVRLPHPDLFTRAFVAVPLFELDADLLLPPEQTPLRDLIRQFHGSWGAPLEELTDDLRRRFLTGPHRQGEHTV